MIHCNKLSSWSTLFWSVDHSHKVYISNSYASETLGHFVRWSTKLGRCACCGDDGFQHWSPRPAYKIADIWHVRFYEQLKVSGFWIPLRSVRKGRNTFFAQFLPITWRLKNRSAFDRFSGHLLSRLASAKLWFGVSTTSFGDLSSAKLTDGD